MSISCQYDSMSYPFFLEDLSKSISIRESSSWSIIVRRSIRSFGKALPLMLGFDCFDDLLVVSGRYSLLALFYQTQ